MTRVVRRQMRVAPICATDVWHTSPDGVITLRLGWELRPRTALYALDRPMPPIGKVAVTYRDGRTFVMSAPMADADRRYGMRVVETRLNGATR